MNNKSEIVTLYENKTECCGCGACSEVCPKSAITMINDEYGFTFPQINTDKCINCKLCIKSCSLKTDLKMNFPLRTYAAVNKIDTDLKISSSGGMFSVFAKKVLENNGAVYGAALYYDNSKLNVRHMRITNPNEIPLLQGSKYVQSNTEGVFSEVKKDLESNSKVLFTGTPCQIASLRAYLQKDYDNLLTIDIICHGVPSEKIFQDYISCIEYSKNIKINDYKFRYKNKGQGMSSYISYISNNYIDKCSKSKVVNGKEESYVFLFLKSFIYRDSCYSCKYAKKERCSDITIGDYWGFISEHPDADDSIYSNQKGISCLIINTEKGDKELENVQSNMYLLDTDLYSIAKHNKQLVSPSLKPKNREKVLAIYRDYGYEKVNIYFKKTFRKEILLEKFKYVLPKSLKRKIAKTVSLLSHK